MGSLSRAFCLFALLCGLAYACDPVCDGCSGGTTASDCIACVQNAELVNGTCQCKQHWFGSDCSDYRGPCCMFCATCTGPYVSNCTRCAPYASFDMGHRCVYDQVGVYNKSAYGINCDPRCYGGCFGTSNTDCYECSSGAQRNYSGQCVCYGESRLDDCSDYVGPYGSYSMYYHHCSPKCAGPCLGPTASDCMGCCDHASRNPYGSCQCNPYYSGLDCTISSMYSVCDYKCNGCSGPTNMHCNSCVSHAYLNSGFCTCESYWSGDDCYSYVGMCDLRCDGCYGPSADCCNKCSRNSFKNVYGYCVCIEDWDGADCTQYNGFCYDTCDSCCGPEPTDCLTCQKNATLNSDGTCSCNEDWGGEDCSIFEGACYATCNGCSGPFADQCDFCIENAGFNTYHICECNVDWEGADCQKYTGTCDAKCRESSGCHGERSDDCVFCNDNSIRDQYMNCICRDGWTGADCGTYSGACAEACESCTGPERGDCTACSFNAERNRHGICRCLPEYYGMTCNESYGGQCASACLTCQGNDAYDCIECAPNAVWIGQVGCQCNDMWTGFRCTEYIGPCDPRCQGGCTGPSASDCYRCVTNAHQESFYGNYDQQLHAAPDGECACLDDWFGPSCDVYEGPCATTCDSTDTTHLDAYNDDLINHYASQIKNNDDLYYFCAGPLPQDCYSCAANAFRNERGECECLPDYHSAADCSVYSGECHPTCLGCKGPGPDQCIECNKLTSTDLSEQPPQYDDGKSCPCDPVLNSGIDCMYNLVPCDGNDSLCITCATGYKYQSGSAAEMRCIACVENAFFDPSSNNCICLSDWDSTSACDTYTGFCHVTCSDTTTCSGPSRYACEKCGDNAFRNLDGGCECMEGYSEEAVNGCVWTEGCWDLCSTCTGPGPLDCNTCHANADSTPTPATNMLCECDANYSGRNCELYYGTCDALCDGCYGPLASDCIRCTTNSGRYYDSTTNALGACTCYDDWDSSDNCATWDGACDPVCDATGGCSAGPTAADCVECTTNAVRGDDGICRCGPGWSQLPDCSEYDNCNCHPTCIGCVGPTSDDCISCAYNATGGSGSSCDCDSGWFGNMCDIYNGACHELCETCYGPSYEDCITLVINATYNEDGDAYCDDDGWDDGYFDQDNNSAIDGQQNCIWNGHCHQMCATCFGPSADECISCFKNAYFNYEGRCECLPDWGGHSDSDTGSDVQYPWDSDDDVGSCDYYGGMCPPYCSTCSGPDDINCMDQDVNNDGSYCLNWGYPGMLDGDATDNSECGGCQSDYIGPQCQYYAGACDSMCRSCFGPSEYQCYECVENAYMDADGTDSSECLCLTDYDSTNFCATYDGACSSYCADCTGPEPWECINCQTHAYVDEFGWCQCDHFWNGHGTCDEYSGPCDPRCDGCTDVGPNQCVTCAYHALYPQVPYLTSVSSDDFIDDSSLENYCECAADYGGDDCTFYTGECDDMCFGCFGPEDYQCIFCRDGAYMTDSTDPDRSLCTCSADRTGDLCQYYAQDCYPTCLTCSGTGYNECESCAFGYYLLDEDTEGYGECFPCPTAGVLDCTDDDYDVANACSNGYYLATDECVKCDLSCRTCDGAGPAACTTCWDDATIGGGSDGSGAGLDTFISNGACVCNDGYRMVIPDGTYESIEFGCRTRCPSLWTLVDSGTDYDGSEGICYQDNTDTESGFLIDLTEPYAWDTPIDDTISATNITFTQCEPQWHQGDDRGNYFNGENHSIDIMNLWWSFWDQSISFIFMPMDRYDFTLLRMPLKTCSNNPDDMELEIWVDRLGYMHLDIGDIRLSPVSHSLGPLNLNEWTWTVFETDCWTDLGTPNIAGDCTITITHVQICGCVGTISWTADRSVLVPDVSLNHLTGYESDGNRETTIGSWKGVTSFFKGFMAHIGFNYGSAAQTAYADPNWVWGSSSTTPWVLGSDGAWNNWVLTLCPFGQYDDGTGTCESCDATCTRGCEDSTGCSYCHDSCYSCESGDTGIQECTACRCGAVMTDPTADKSSCQCAPGYLGTAEGCKPNCADHGCSVCTGLLEHSCELCDDDHRMSPDGDGTCEFCKDTPDFLFSQSCSPKDHCWANSHSTCPEGTFWDNNYEVCRQMAATCSNECYQYDSTSDATTISTFLNCCDLCDADSWKIADQDYDGNSDTFDTVGRDYCVTWTPSLYESDSSDGFIYLCTEGGASDVHTAIADFCFAKGNTESDAKVWTYSNTCTGSYDGASVSVTVTGGALANQYEATDPFISDRGAWFNGRSDFMTIDGITFSHTWWMGVWARPIGSGTIYSNSNSVDYAGEEKSIHWGIRGDAVEFEDKIRNYYWKTNSGSVNLSSWNLIAIKMLFDGTLMNSRIYFYHEGVEIQTVTYLFLFLDPPNANMTKRLGVVERTETLLNHYHGHIYEFKAFNGEYNNVDQHVYMMGDNCNKFAGCAICPVTDDCLNDCGWNEYPTPNADGKTCSKCPTWCLNGCNEDGSC